MLGESKDKRRGSFNWRGRGIGMICDGDGAHKSPRHEMRTAVPLLRLWSPR